MDRPQGIAQFKRTLDPVAGRLLQAARVDSVEVAWEVGAGARQRLGGVAKKGRCHLRLGGPSEWPPPAQKLEQNAAEREQARARVPRLAAQLLGRHVWHGAR